MVLDYVALYAAFQACFRAQFSSRLPRNGKSESNMGTTQYCFPGRRMFLFGVPNFLSGELTR